MEVGYIFLFASFVALIAVTKEVPIEGSTLPPEIDESHIDAKEEKSDVVKRVSLPGRFNYSKMLTMLTTVEYDEWHYTTRRPILSYKDFPGRPGVASWREISMWKDISPESSSEEKEKSPKMSSPTSAGVSSGSQNIPSKYHCPQIIWMLFLFLCFCWA